ncbi:MAG: phage terminase large subunit [Bacillota bacterium]
MLNHEEFYELIKLDKDFRELKQLEAYENFWDFCLYMDYEFFYNRSSILKPVAEAFQRIEEGNLNLLYVAMPPRTGKSYITTLFAAWSLGRDPTGSIMRNTVTATLYSKFSTDCRDIMQGETHDNKYKEIFPQIKFSVDKVDGWKLKQSQKGVSYFGAGVGGSIIGFGCSKVAILDDSVKNWEEAMNENTLNKKWDWYTSTHRSRKEKGCPEIHIATRWSVNDIPGKLIQDDYFDSPDAEKIVIPAIIDGKSYCEAAHSKEELLEEKKINDDMIWQAEWMQNPIEAKGLLFKQDELNRFNLEDIKNHKPDAIIGFCDTADEGTDFLSFPIAKKIKGKYFITDVVFTQEPVEISEPLVVQSIINNDIEDVTIESNNGGRIFAKDIKELLHQSNYYCNVNSRAETRNKETRILMQSGFIKENFYFRKDYEEGSPYDKFMQQFLTYSKAGKNKHDDAPDSLTGLADRVRNKKSRITWGS